MCLCGRVHLSGCHQQQINQHVASKLESDIFSVCSLCDRHRAGEINHIWPTEENGKEYFIFFHRVNLTEATESKGVLSVTSSSALS